MANSFTLLIKKGADVIAKAELKFFALNPSCCEFFTNKPQVETSEVDKAVILGLFGLRHSP